MLKLRPAWGGAGKPMESLIATFFADRPGVAAVYLFGSLAAGTATPESDVDIGVLYQRGLEPYFHIHMD